MNPSEPQRPGWFRPIILLWLVLLTVAIGYLAVKIKNRNAQQLVVGGDQVQIEVFGQGSSSNRNGAVTRPLRSDLRARPSGPTRSVPPIRLDEVEPIALPISSPPEETGVEATQQFSPGGVARGLDNATQPSVSMIRGKVTLKGTPPREKRIEFTDKFCGVVNSNQNITTRHYLVSPDRGLANVFVYLKQGAIEQFPRPTNEVVLDQAGCLYEPYVFGLVTNQQLLIKNSDDTFHNVNIQPKNPLNKPSNKGQPPRSPDLVKIFPEEELLIRFMCNVHPWMFSYANVVPHPFFSVTDSNGNFALPGRLRRGTYDLEAVHPKAGRSSQTISIGSSPVTLNFTLEVPGQ